MSALIEIVLVLFALGGVMMALGCRRADPAERRRRCVKFAVYLLIVMGVLAAAALEKVEAVVAAISAVGAWELLRVLERRRLSSWLIGAAYLVIVSCALHAAFLLDGPTVAFLYVVVAAFDGFSQAFGQLFGRHKLAPAISPSKTVEGAAGGLAGALGVALLCRGVMPLRAGEALVIAAVISFCGLAGDLAASWIKRRAGVKDFSALLPGHGGALDRFDSFLPVLAVCGAAPGAWGIPPAPRILVGQSVSILSTMFKETQMTAWGFADIPDLSGRTAIVTGANTGIGFEAARMLAQKGADVVLACRTPEKGLAAAEKIRAQKPKGSASFAQLDLSDLESVAAFAASVSKVDLLINNAGVMVPPLGRTKQGFELQFGTNHLGHFALTGRLLPVLLATPGARVVVLSSTAQNFGKIVLEDLNWEKRRYVAWAAYSQSKLANMIFTLELARRLGGLPLKVTAAHPGWTATDLQRTAGLVSRLNPIFAMKPADGALPTLRAAVDPAAKGGSYWGPQGLFELSGAPGPARISKRAHDAKTAAALWEVSEELTSVRFPLPAPGEQRKAG